MTLEQQCCLVQSRRGDEEVELRTSHPLPKIEHPHEVLVRVTAVALNPVDYKFAKYQPCVGAVLGSDFCGHIAQTGTQVTGLGQGDRVCGAVQGCNRARPGNGAFAEYLVADSRLLLRVPEGWSDLQAAALGGVGWHTAGLVMYDALGLVGRPSNPLPARQDGSRVPVLVYGGATATGTMLCQLLSLYVCEDPSNYSIVPLLNASSSGYATIATASPASSAMVRSFGAVSTIPYAESGCVERIRAETNGELRHAVDCIANFESMSICVPSLCRAGGHLACLEAYEPGWVKKRSVRVSFVMGPEVLGMGVDAEGVCYRSPDPDKLQLAVKLKREIQEAIDAGQIENHPLLELQGGWDGIRQGLQMLQRQEVRGRKLVVRLKG